MLFGHGRKRGIVISTAPDATVARATHRKRRAPSWFDPYRYLVKPYFILAAIYLLGIVAIIRADFYYVDDLGRAAWGYTQWEYFSRYISVGLSHLVHANGYLTDIAPLTQVIAVFILALAGMILIHVLGEGRKVSAWQLIACIPIGLSPFFLECLSYRFDAPYMALSILAMVAPLLFANRRPFVYMVAVFIGTLIMTMTYQAAAGIFPMAVILRAFIGWQRRQPGMGRFVLFSLIGYVCGLALFALLLMRPVDDYVSTSLPPLSALIPTIITNYGKFYTVIATDLKPLWLGLIAAVIVLFPIAAALNTRRNRWASAGLAIAVLAAFGLLAFGIYPLLEKPLVGMGSGLRALYGFGVMLGLVSLFITQTPRYLVGKLFVLALSWVFFVFAFSYGNALSLQKDWIDFRIEETITAIDSVDEEFGDSVAVAVQGDAGLAPPLRNWPEADLRLLQDIVSQSFGGPWIWDHAQFFDYYGLSPRFYNIGMLSEEQQQFYDSLPVLKDGIYATLKGDRDHLLITVKD